MGKYIIELEDKPFHKEDGDFLYRVKGFNSLVFDMTGISKLTPYTEPDLERVKKTAHDDGYSEGYQAGREDLNQVMSQVKKDYDAFYENGYQRGLSDAWDAARKIIRMPEVDLLNLFTECYSAVCTPLQVFLKYDASECIEKIRQYEQEQDTEIKVGDEVELKCGVRPAIYMQGTKGSDEIYLLFNDGSCGLHSKSEIECKTGRHFPEIASVLDRMREDGNQNRIQETMSDDY